MRGSGSLIDSARSGWHFDAIGVEHFSSLVKFTLRAEDDDGSADMGEIRMVLDNNEQTLRHLCLGASLNRDHSWDEAFESSVIRNLTQLELVDTRISHLVLTRLIHASPLRALTLHGTFEDPNAAAVILGSDHLVDGQHTLLPFLDELRFVMVGHDDETHLFQAITQFLRGRARIRRLDLGSCPFDLLMSVLPSLTALRVLRLKTGFLGEQAVASLVKALPREMTGIHVAVGTSVRSLVGRFACSCASGRVGLITLQFVVSAHTARICARIHEVHGAVDPASQSNIVSKTPAKLDV